jgi:anti-sigma regulatory factor (Ser/Thr protein kinase)
MPVSMSSAEILRLRLRCDHEAPRLAREALGALEAAQPVRDDALLVASELTTNAVLHGSGEAEQEIELVAERVPDGLRISVCDTGSAGGQGGGDGGRSRPPPGPVGVSLRIVQAIARRWGAEPSNGQRLWAVLAL